jgi:NADH-quinone oxidoreductase subunit N
MNILMSGSQLFQGRITQEDLDKLGKIEWGALWPAWVASVGILLILMIDLVLPKAQRQMLAWISLLIAVASGGSAFIADYSKTPLFQGMVAADEMSRFMAVIIFGTVALAIMASPDYFSRIGLEARGEYYALMLMAGCGMWLLSIATNFMILFVALELFSLALYILASFLPRSSRSQEAGFKYFLLSSFASAFMLYGIALLFGAYGTTSYSGLQRQLADNLISGPNGLLVLIGLAMLSVGFAFKISAVPFHMWTPDVYEGAPTPVTALMAIGTKAAIVAAFLRTFNGALEPIAQYWQPILFVLAIITMIGGNILAMTQPNIKRMLAYSAVAHAGYILIGIVANNQAGLQGVLFYLLSYSVMTMGAFAVVMALEGPRGEGLEIADFTGLGRTHPWLAAVLMVCLLSLGGIPPMAGFFGKALVFSGAVQVGGWQLLLPLVGAVTSVVAVFYYFRIVVRMYMVDTSVKQPLSGRPAISLNVVLFVAGVGTLAIGLLAGVALEWVQQAAATIGQLVVSSK